MSVVAEVTQTATPAHQGLFLFSKGAPEVMADLIADLPSDYKRIYLHHMSKGKRVLAVAYKQLPLTLLHGNKLIKSRSTMETGLIFMGFLIYDTHLKPDSRSVIRELKDSKHTLIMITGDSPHTASDVSLRLGMTDKDRDTLILQVAQTNGHKATKGMLYTYYRAYYIDLTHTCIYMYISICIFLYV